MRGTLSKIGLLLHVARHVCPFLCLGLPLYICFRAVSLLGRLFLCLDIGGYNIYTPFHNEADHRQRYDSVQLIISSSTISKINKPGPAFTFHTIQQPTLFTIFVIYRL